MNTDKKQGPYSFLEKLNFLGGTINYIILYINNCCIHGLIYIVKNGLTVVERLFWLLLIILSLYICVDIALTTLNRYLEKNTHVGMERDYYFWNTSLPSLTICPMNRIDVQKFDTYCEKRKIIGEQKEQLYDFLEHLANSTYINFKNLSNYEAIPGILDKLNIKPQHYMQLIYNVTYDMTYDPIDRYRVRCTHDKAIIHVRQVLTEYGLCYMTNNYLNDKYSSRYMILGDYPARNKFEESTGYLKQVLTGTYFDKDVSYTFIGFSNSIDLFLHSAYDVMKVDNNFGYINEHLEYNPTSMEILTSNNFDKATIQQRHCRFPHESNLTHFPIYTKNLCLQECRLNLVHKICHCIPHFYPNRIRQPKPVCDYRVLKECVAEHSEYFLKIYREDIHKDTNLYDHDEMEQETVECYCDQNCEDSILSVQAIHIMLSSKPLLGSIGAQVSMKSWPHRRLIRTIIFSFSDLLVYIGGTAGLFMGFSVLGLIEIVYFFTFRLIFHLIGYKL